MAATSPTDRPTDVVHEVVKEYMEEAIGTLKAASRSVISTKILATIEEITVAAGARVTTGDVLVRLDGQDWVRVLQAKEAFAAAEATRTEAELTFGRTQELLESRAVSRQNFDSVQRRLSLAWAVIFGILTSTIFTLLVIPVVYGMIDGRRKAES